MAPASSAKDKQADDGRVAVLVVFDAFNWTEINPDTKGREYNSATRGQIVRVTPAEAERAKALGAVMDPPDDPEDAQAVAAGVAANSTPSPGSMSDEQLRGLTVEELVAYVNQYPAELTRVIELEQARQQVTRDGAVVGGGPRPEVMGLVDSQAAQEAALARGQAEADKAAAAQAEADKRAAAGAGAGGGQGGAGQ